MLCADVCVICLDPDELNASKLVAALDRQHPRDLFDMKKKNMNIESETDWQRVMSMSDGEIDTSDIPALTDDFFNNAQIRWPGNKKQLTLRLDPDVVDYFKHLGKGYQRTMNNVLRKFMEAHQH
jgi:uncharacterized protein (DUF4415 family)